jgi:hypothetical protein
MKKIITLMVLMLFTLSFFATASIGLIGANPDIFNDNDCWEESYTYGTATAEATACYHKTFDTEYSEVDYIDLECSQGNRLYINCMPSHCDETGCPPCQIKSYSYSRPYRYYHASENRGSASDFAFVCWDIEENSQHYAWTVAGWTWNGLKYTEQLPDCPEGYNYDNNYDACQREVQDCASGYHWDTDYNICVVDDYVYPDTPAINPPSNDFDVVSWWDKLVNWVKEFFNSLGLGSFVSNSGSKFSSHGGGIS